MFNDLKKMNKLIVMLKHEISEFEKNKPHEDERNEKIQTHLEIVLKTTLEQRTRHIIFSSCTTIFLCGVMVSIVNILLQIPLLNVCVFSINAIGCMIMIPFVHESLRKSFWALLILSFIMIAITIDV